MLPLPLCKPAPDVSTLPINIFECHGATLVVPYRSSVTTAHGTPVPGSRTAMSSHHDGRHYKVFESYKSTGTPPTTGSATCASRCATLLLLGLSLSHLFTICSVVKVGYSVPHSPSPVTGTSGHSTLIVDGKLTSAPGRPDAFVISVDVGV